MLVSSLAKARRWTDFTDTDARYLDTAGPRICDSQKLHFHPDTDCSSGHAESGQGLTRMGLGHWQTKTKRCPGKQEALSAAYGVKRSLHFVR